MRADSFVPEPSARLAPGRLAALMLLAAAAMALPLRAQSVLGTIRGTVTDPQGAVVKAAAVMVTDEATGVPRSVDSDDEGRYEVSNLRPGSYRVDVVTPSFKKFEQPGVVVTTGGVARVDARLEMGGVAETVTVSAEGANIVVESPSVSVSLDAQQLRDLPRNGRDMQSFLLLNPNVLGGSDDIQFLGGRTYGVSYVQDGQASTNAIFGTVGNSAPGLDAISEIQVLSNSYSAEYGGLAGVVVTTKRGGNNNHGSAFYDFNSDSLNALTYNQKQSGAVRGEPNSDTHAHRWGVSLGGPIKTNKTFFFVNYEGSNDQAIFGGGRANVPTAAMRNGDFSATNFIINDPVTGEPFPGNVIPADRIDPTAQRMLDFYYPLPNQGTLSSGMGVYQEFVPHTQNRNRGDLRFDHEISEKDSVFVRGSFQNRDPASIQFETNNSLFPNLGIREASLNTATAIAGWTKILSPNTVNEFRVGYNYDKAERQSHFRVGDVNAELGLETAPSLAADRPGFPSLNFAGGSSATRPSNITDGSRNADRTITQNSFSVSNNLSLVRGSHSFKVGGLWTRNNAVDGFGKGVNFRGQYRFNNVGTGNALANMLLGKTRDVGDHISTRGDLSGHSDDWALFGQDDWRVNNSLTVFLGLRWELVGVWHEDNDAVANFLPVDGGFHVVPNAEIASLLPPPLQALGRIRLASEAGFPDALINPDKNNFSPRLGFAWRVGGNDQTVVRGGFGLFHPTVAVQGVRDLLAANEFRYTQRYSGGGLATAYSAGTPFVDPADFGNQGINPDVESPDIYQYNLTLERALPGDLGVRVSYIGSTMRKLLVDRDFNTLPASTVPFDPFNPDDYARLPFPQYGYYMDNVDNRGEGQLHAAQVELRRRFRDGLAMNVAYTYAHSDGNAPDTGNSSLGPVMFDPYDIEKDRGPDPNVVKHRLVMNATWEVPLGHGRKHGANMPGWADALFGGWTVSSLFQARSGNNLTPFFSSFYTTSPWNTGKPLDGLGNFFCCAWRPDQVKDPNVGGGRDAFYDATAYALPAPGQLGNAKKGSLRGPGTWVVNFGIFKDILSRDRFHLQLSALLDNAFNHPQFYAFYGDEFSQVDSFVIDGELDNGTMANLGAGAIDNREGFAPGRVFRIGLRATF